MCIWELRLTCKNMNANDHLCRLMSIWKRNWRDILGGHFGSFSLLFLFGVGEREEVSEKVGRWGRCKLKIEEGGVPEEEVRGRGKSGGAKRDKLKGTNARNSQFFADFRRFLLIFAFPGNYSILEAQIFAENRRKLQIFADFPETRLSHFVCPF